jgi:hypothetical protein
VRKVEFSPEEMAYEPTPENTANWLPVGGHAAWARFRRWRKNVAVLEPKVRTLYPSDAELNKALLKLADAASHVRVGR